MQAHLPNRPRADGSSGDPRAQESRRSRQDGFVLRSVSQTVHFAGTASGALAREVAPNAPATESRQRAASVFGEEVQCPFSATYRYGKSWHRVHASMGIPRQQIVLRKEP
eukprot:scaffold1883_cov396-Prasinococcus_capsulatus_cf.AAC.13